MKARKGKTLDGAPRSGRWTRETPAKRKIGGRHHGSLVVLAALAVLVLGGVGVFGLMARRQLQDGILEQYREQRARRDWVGMGDMPAYLPAAFVAVVDTTSFTRVAPHADVGRPMLARDLLTQVHRLDGGMGDQARRVMMLPILERELSPRERLELYLNRVYLGRTGEWPVYGVFHAAEEYFGKEPRRLTLGEAATLAGLLLPPRLPEPENTPGAVGTRRNEVLRKMLSAGDIDEAAFRAATAEPLGFQPGVDYAPMTRPAGWRAGAEAEVIRLPPELRPTSDSLPPPGA